MAVDVSRDERSVPPAMSGDNRRLRLWRMLLGGGGDGVGGGAVGRLLAPIGEVIVVIVGR